MFRTSLSCSIGLVAALAFAANSRAAGDGPANPHKLGGGLRQLAEWHGAEVTPLPEARRLNAVQQRIAENPRIQSDGGERVVADVRLDGTVPPAAVQTVLEGLGCTVLAVEAPGRPAAPKGVLSIYMPVRQATAIIGVAGVQSVVLVHRPWHHVGVVTSQGVKAMGANLVQKMTANGVTIDGTGISVGVLSDSYDLTPPHAKGEVKLDDLPGLGNKKHPVPVVIPEGGEGNPNEFETDEGRAMLQIIHDVAPGAALAFFTTGDTTGSFAANIRALRGDATAHCDVLVDDVGFPDEPYFSVGVVEQAVQDVVTSTTLPGKKVIYYSAAGNASDLGYEADFSPISNTLARNGQAGTNNLQLSQVPSNLTVGGFHNFTPGNGINIAQKIIVTGTPVEIDLQWDDLFNNSKVTSDFNLLVFDDKGVYQGSLSGTDNNFTTDQPMELVDLNPGPKGAAKTYQLAITAAVSGTSQHLRYIPNTDGGLDGTYLQMAVPTIVGHSGARDGDGVGAYYFKDLSAPESFSSWGPVTLYFDDQGIRLAPNALEVRKQPTISAPDGVATSMPFFRPFFGTSAAAPHAAGIAALLLQAKGGPGSLTALQMRTALQQTSLPHNLNPLTSVATAQDGGGAGTVTVTGMGDDSNVASDSPTFFTVAFTGPAGSSLQTLTIDLGLAKLDFDLSKAKGFPFTVGNVTGGVSTTVTSALKTGKKSDVHGKLILTFSAFPAGGTLQFGIDRDMVSTHAGGNAAYELANGTTSATILPPAGGAAVTVTGAFANDISAASADVYSPADGYGFINAQAALTYLLQH